MKISRAALAVTFFGACTLLSRSARAEVEGGLFSPTPIEWVLIMGGLALLPFVVIMVTSFVKVAVVLAILRSALGAQGIPPTQVIVGLSLILTVFIMAPVGHAMVERAKSEIMAVRAADEEQGGEEGAGDEQGPLDGSLGHWSNLTRVGQAALVPLKDFLTIHAHPGEIALFVELGQAAPDEPRASLSQDDFLVLIPAFVVSELKEAFQIGFLIFIPFIIIDMVVANILLSLGMHMLNPTTVSLPFKLLLFVMVDGWYLLVRGLVVSYQVGVV